MEKSTLVLNIHLEERKNNCIKGHITIATTTTIKIAQVVGTVYMELRGRMGGFKEEMFFFNIDENVVALKNTLHTIPFWFEVPKNSIESYKGKNFEVLYSFEADLRIASNEVEKLERSFFSRLKSTMNSMHSVKKSAYFLKENINKRYKVVSQTSFLTLEGNSVTGISSFFLVGFIYLILFKIFNFELQFFHIFICVIFLIFIVAIITFYKGKLIGKVSVKLVEAEKGFICKVYKKDFKLKNPKIYYKITESVIDTRGSSRSHYTEELYKSPITKLSKNNEEEVYFEYPNAKNLTPFSKGDVSIYWEVFLEGEFSGLKESYKTVIDVRSFTN
ncbi:hypothetical protein R5O24_11080 [Tenacibaculum maritimum]|uniref:hypothetical protein n=1 Tax=Tenacibaculum maritimum TaxID=107401 RepID=UPI00388E47C3